MGGMEKHFETLRIYSTLGLNTVLYALQQCPCQRVVSFVLDVQRAQ